MSKIVQSLRRNPLLLFAAFVVVVVLPLLAKFLVTGAVGPSTDFFVVVIWMPLMAIVFSTIKSPRDGWTMATAILIACGLIYFSYPQEPLMNFQRQMVYHQSRPLMATILLVFAIQILTPMIKASRNKATKS